MGIGAPSATDEEPASDGDKDEEETETASALGDPVDFLLNATTHIRLLSAEEEKVDFYQAVNADPSEDQAQRPWSVIGIWMGGAHWQVMRESSSRWMSSVIFGIMRRRREDRGRSN